MSDDTENYAVKLVWNRVVYKIPDLRCMFCNVENMHTTSVVNSLRCYSCGVRVMVTNPSSLPLNLGKLFFRIWKQWTS